MKKMKETLKPEQASNGMHGSSGNNNRHRWHAPLLHYNKQASKILDRKPEYIGKDIHSHHKKATSNKKIDLMFQDFQKRRTEPFHYQAKPYGKTILVTLSPILENGKFIGCIPSICAA
jgi:DUF438 domain-containing protein